MAFDFDPDLSQDVEIIQNETNTSSISNKSNKITEVESSLVLEGSKNQDVVTINNLLGLTQSHINDDNECREVIGNLTEELNNSIHLMSVKEMLEYLKVKIREREFHVQCIFKAYDFIQKSEYAREAFIGNHRRERIIEATDRSRIKGLLDILTK